VCLPARGANSIAETQRRLTRTGDPVLNVTDADVALTEIYQGQQRMTLTYPTINRSPRVLWLVTGSEKAGPLTRLRAGDASIPAGRVNSRQALVLADEKAAARL
jgi:6-phosphogluconolactonase